MKGLVFTVFILYSSLIVAQSGVIAGHVSSHNADQEFVKIKLSNGYGAVTDSVGNYAITKLPFGEFILTVYSSEFLTVEKTVVLDSLNPVLFINFELEPISQFIDQVVVTGTRTNKRQTDSPVIVDIIDTKTLEAVQACNLSEGLKFQPGLRVETDCQTCNYTQLRMNGLAGGYSQILINGRPVFSPLTGLYGLEQIPANMIDRIEVVRGGGSALYGSSAIGGTVNVITKIPKESAFSVSNNYQNINGLASDNIISGNANVLTHKRNAGASFFVNNRNREAYDHNRDNFSELPALKTTSFGTNLFVRPNDQQKLEITLSTINEYRYGGEMVEKAAHLAQQSEERTHNVMVGGIDYQYNFKNENSSIIVYGAGQRTTRLHYTGIYPDDSLEITDHLTDPPYGNSLVTTIQGGTQFNHRFEKFIKGSNVFTVGGEYLEDMVKDDIVAYNYKINQLTANLGMFLQSDWEISKSIKLLLGARADKHNMLDNLVVSPRASFMYKLKESTQFRATWGTGFRAPQAFDADLHIAFAGGGISRITLADNLVEERSQSFGASVNYDKKATKYIAGFTVEGFYTYLKNAFYQHPLGEDAFGELYEKRNGAGATVMGASLQLRANFNKKVEFDGGITFQSSLFDAPIEYSDVLPATNTFLRTPNVYGYGTLFYTPNKKFSASMNTVYTGPMKVLHLAGAPEQLVDEIITSKSFVDLSLKVGYTFLFKKLDSGLELFGGMKNIFNSYQESFDIGKNRDSNFVYGPSLPRTFYIGMKVFSL
ncbi:MAG: outer membrane receptor for ferrienterochelin and colicins [Crocinitomicaceae bacterium]|jgi:outer membrane receptor for ferrienterochelin and colicins